MNIWVIQRIDELAASARQQQAQQERKDETRAQKHAAAQGRRGEMGAIRNGKHL